MNPTQASVHVQLISFISRSGSLNKGTVSIVKAFNSIIKSKYRSSQQQHLLHCTAIQSQAKHSNTRIDKHKRKTTTQPKWDANNLYQFQHHSPPKKWTATQVLSEILSEAILKRKSTPWSGPTPLCGKKDTALTHDPSKPNCASGAM